MEKKEIETKNEFNILDNSKKTSEIKETFNSVNSHPELDILNLIKTNPTAMNYYNLKSIKEEEIPFLQNAKELLCQDPSLENFEKISKTIPKKRLDLGRMLSYIYAELNNLEESFPIVIDSLRYYHPNFMNLSENDLWVLKNILNFFEQNANAFSQSEEATRIQLEGVDIVPKDRQDLRDAVVLLFYSVMFDWLFIFNRDTSSYKI